MASASGPVTQLLLAWSYGDRAALERLIPVVYPELRRIAGRYLRRERIGHTLQPTALVNEAYLKLINQEHAHWQSRAQFFGVAAQLMRRILVDHARERAAGKRGGGATPITLVDGMGASQHHEAAEGLTNLTNSDATTYDADMGKVINLYEAKSQLSALVEQAAAGEEIVIAKAGVPRARLVPVKPRLRRRPGGSKGRIWIARDFDAPLPPDIADAFEGKRRRKR